MLPVGVRRRLSRRDGRLPAILMGELMAGMALGMVWPVLTSPPPPVPQTAMTAVQAPVPVVPQTPQLPPVVHHVPKHAPRNPFGVPQGVDAASLPAVVPLTPPPAGGSPALPPGMPAPLPGTAPARPGTSVPPPTAGVAPPPAPTGPTGPSGGPLFADDGTSSIS